MPTLSPLHPLTKEVAEQLRERMRRILVRLDEMRALAASPSAWMPPIDICELEDAILVKVELPGVSLDNLRLTLLDNTIKIEGRKDRDKPRQSPGSATEAASESEPEPEKPIRFICLERSYGAFAFSIAINWRPIVVEKITAKLSDGVLIVRLPKTPTSGREIAITISE
ncbi:MAG: Hsp20/alpha crystallin family protein [Blastocatellia bacterium]|nr:Hsp20/alpha crystallin family protein [Blastocatellia bacterium]